MPIDKFLVAPLSNSGLQTNLKPWLIPDEAFVRMDNCYVFRGRIRKRFGSLLTGIPIDPTLAWPTSRVAVYIGTTDPMTGDLTVSVLGVIWKIGQQFVVDLQIFTVWQVTGDMLISTGAAGTATFDTTNGDLVLAGVALNAPVYYYLSEPIMGITQYEEGAINNYPTVAFDTQFAYQYNGSNWQDFSGALWHDPSGLRDNFFWSTNWRGGNPTPLLFTTNFQWNINAPNADDDPIYYWDSFNWIAFYAYFAPSGAPQGPEHMFLLLS